MSALGIKRMNLLKNDLTKEGTISFVISLKDNPLFRNPDSNINFMHNKDLGGVRLTFLKEKEEFKVEVVNPQYGKTRIIHNISELLNKGMTVALTWNENLIKLYINGALAEEDILKKGKGLIKVVLKPEASELTQDTNISYDEIHDTINDRHRGLLIPGNPMRIGAIHWFDDKIVFLIAYVTKSHAIENIIKFEEVEANLILKVREHLPAGNINRNLNFVEILNIVAESFGIPVTTSKNGEPKLLHIESEWDGTINLKSEKDETIFVQGTFSPNENKCHYVWAFSLDKYRSWLQGLNAKS